MARARMIDEKVASTFILVALVAALLAGTVTVLASFIGWYRLTLWNLIDAGMFFALAYGIFRKSRTCAIILFTYHIINRFDMWTRTKDLQTSFGGIACALVVVYFLGILGTFAYHSIQKEK